MMAAWETKKRMKIGVSVATDSLTPLRLSRIRARVISRMNVSLWAKKAGGRKLSTASTPLEMEMLIVSM